jgi:hypothetical protein
MALRNRSRLPEYCSWNYDRHCKRRVRFRTDGIMTIAPGMPGEQTGDAVNPWDEVLHGSAEQKRPS